MIDQPVVRVHNVVKSFGDHTVLGGISLSVRRGETLVILGRSGTGKSVLLKILIGLLDPTSGEAEILGTRFADLTPRERLAARRSIGYVFQGGALFDSLSVADNVGFPLHQRRVNDATIAERARERLAMVGLEHASERMPSELSGGMQKRVALARALIDLPEVMLYDEPTSGLDPLTTDVINQIILRLRSKLGVTSIVVTHDIGSAMTIADRIVMLDRGRVIATGTPSEIQQHESNWVQHFLRGQALDSETLDSGAFARPKGLSGMYQAATSASGRRATTAASSGSSRLLTPIRARKRSGALPAAVKAAEDPKPAKPSLKTPIRLRRPRAVDPGTIDAIDPEADESGPQLQPPANAQRSDS